MKAFFLFVGALLVAGIAFGLYVSGLDKCSVMAARNTGFTELECHKLYLAFGVLFAVAILLLLSAAFYAFVPPPQGAHEHPGKQIFDNFMKVLPPIVTLVLGYYFGSMSPANPPKDHSGPAAAQVPAPKASAPAASAP